MRSLSLRLFIAQLLTSLPTLEVVHVQPVDLKQKKTKRRIFMTSCYVLTYYKLM